MAIIEVSVPENPVPVVASYLLAAFAQGDVNPKSISVSALRDFIGLNTANNFVEVWAKKGDTTPIPPAKLVHAASAAVQTWAQATNTDEIPIDKLLSVFSNPNYIRESLESLTGNDRLSREYLSGETTANVGTELPDIDEVPLGALYLLQYDSASLPILYVAKASYDTAVSNRNRFVFTVRNGLFQLNPDSDGSFQASDNYNEILGTFIADMQASSDYDLQIDLLASADGLPANMGDVFVNISGDNSGQLRFVSPTDGSPTTVVIHGKVYNSYVSDNYTDAYAASSLVNGEVTINLFSDSAGANPIAFKPEFTHTAGRWVPVSLTQADIDRLNEIHDGAGTDILDTTGVSGSQSSGNIIGFENHLEGGSQVSSGTMATRTFNIGAQQMIVGQLTVFTDGLLQFGYNVNADKTILPADLPSTWDIQVTTGGTTRDFRLRDATISIERGTVNVNDAEKIYEWDNAAATTMGASGDAFTFKIIDKSLKGNIIPDGGTAGQIVTRDSGGNLIWTNQTGGGGGLDQAAVDARIDAAIPVARRIPTFAAGDANEVLTVSDDGNSIGFEPLPDESKVLEVRSSLPNVSGFSTGDMINVTGEIYELVASGMERSTVTGVARSLAARNSNAYNGTNDLEWRVDGDSPLTVIAHLDQAVLGSSPPAKVGMDFFTKAGFVQRDLVLTRDQSLDRAGDTYAYVEGDTGLSDGTPRFGGYIGSKFTANFYSLGVNDARTGDLNVLPAVAMWKLEQREFPPPLNHSDVYEEVKTIVVAGDDISVTQNDPMDTLTVAYTGTSPRAFTLLQDSSPIGISVANHATVRRNQLRLFDPNFDFDVASNQHGIIDLEATLAFGNRGDVQIGFDDNTSDPQLSSRMTGFVTGTAVRTATAYANNADNGAKLFDWSIKKGSDDVGTVSLYLAKDSQNRLGYYLVYHPGDDSQSNWDMTLALTAVFFHTDAGAQTSGIDESAVDARIAAKVRAFAQADSSDKISRTDLDGNQQLPTPASNQWLKWNSGATQLENVDAPSTASPSSIGEFNLTVSAGNLNQYQDSGIDIPATGDWAAFSIGRVGRGVDTFENLSFQIFQLSRLRALAVSTSGTEKTNSSSLGFRIFDAQAGRAGDIFFGRTSANRLLIAGDNANVSAMPIRFWHINWGSNPVEKEAKQSTITPSVASTAVATNGTVEVALAAGNIDSGHGISISNHDIVFANAGLYVIDWSIQLAFTADPDVSFGAARNFIDCRWSRTRATVDTVLKSAYKTGYSRAMSDATGARTGPDEQRVGGSFQYLAQANDRLFLELIATFVQATGVSLVVSGTESEITISSYS